MSTFYRIGNKVFSLEHVEEVDLHYDSKRYDRDGAPVPAGVEVILASGRSLRPFFGDQARALRDYLEGRPVEKVYHLDDPDTTVIELRAIPIPADVPPPGDGDLHVLAPAIVPAGVVP